MNRKDFIKCLSAKLKAPLLGGLLSVAMPVCAQLNTDRMTDVGRNALYFEDYVLAIQHFNQVIAAKPYLAEPYYLRAIAKYSLEDYVGAEQDASEAIDRNAFLPDAWEVRGVARQCLGKNAEAVNDYDHALRLLPFNRQLLFSKALAEEDAGMNARADSTYKVLLENYPGFDNGYVGRAQLHLHREDTLSARADLNRALEINPNSVQALTLRASVESDPALALADMERAVTLQPDRTFLRINRAVARYNNGDLNGALSDFDYVIELEPTNYAALFNRAMLRTELKDNDRALRDLNRVIALKPTDMRALYNRAVVLADKRDFDAALADASAIVEAYPEMFAAYALRGEILRQAGHEARANADFRRAEFLARRPADNLADTPSGVDPTELPDEGATANRFKTLVTMNDEAEQVEQTFNTAGLRGRVQDRMAAVELQPLYQLSYYSADGEVSTSVYVRAVNELNVARALPYIVYVTNNVPAMTREADAARHFTDIQRLGAIITSGRATPLDYFARAMDYMTVRDYKRALTDLDSVISASPDFAPAYLQRAAARVLLQESRRGETLEITDPGTESRLNAETSMTLNLIMADLDRALALDPLMAVAHYNRGTILLRMGADIDAIDAFSRAIELDPTLGAAYFNRGYARFSRGNRDGAIADISRAGQLGIHSGYSLLKRMQQQ
ncbi:MAG: tetratricopeptide repeat protein [Muribaculaceae bacterium]|nr:tetratricopeptide repeat protein [Muribaculaceae bacterium]